MCSTPWLSFLLRAGRSVPVILSELCFFGLWFPTPKHEWDLSLDDKDGFTTKTNQHDALH